MKYYDLIKEKRIALGITQEEMAKKLGYTDRSSIAKIESGNVDISYSKIVAIAEILGLDPVEFFEFEEEKEEVVALYNRLSRYQKEAFLDLLRSTASDDRG